MENSPPERSNERVVVKFELDRQVKYAGMLWLLAAQVAVMLPFVSVLPGWLVLVLLASAAWRIRVIRGHWAQPSFMLKVAVVALGISGLVLSGFDPLSLDTMSSLLLLAFAFKSIEVIHRRDAVVVVFTGYFLVAIHFLYSQTIAATLYGIACLILLTAALVAAHQTRPKKMTAHLSLAGLMILQALPLMIIVYLFFPRLPPLWAVSMPGGSAMTGISDHMAPGDIASLSQSDEIAFRVTFKGERPAQQQLYWRGLVLNDFDGRAWHQFSTQLSSAELLRLLHTRPEAPVSHLGEPLQVVEYDVIYEATQQNWLFTLSPVTKWDADAIMGFDYRLMAKQPLQAAMSLKATSVLNARRGLRPEKMLRNIITKLPAGQNPRSRRLAEQWRGQVSNAQEYAAKVMASFRQQPFYYTLRPPLAGVDNTIDQFLFDSRRGFCSHYAGSFVFMMRAVGLPARVVIGYQGGEWNEGGDYLTVRQYDAHAWAEVWIENQGWVRYDPTAMVAPQRIEQNLQTAMQQEGSFLEQNLFSPARISWLKGLRQKWDSVQYAWRRWVLGYDEEMQSSFLKNWLGELTVAKIGLMFATLFAMVLALWAVWLGLTRSQHQASPAVKLYRKFCRKLEKRGLLRALDTTPAQFAEIAARQFPERSDPIREVTRLFERISYCESAQTSDALLGRLRAAVRRV